LVHGGDGWGRGDRLWLPWGILLMHILVRNLSFVDGGTRRSCERDREVEGEEDKRLRRIRGGERGG